MKELSITLTNEQTIAIIEQLCTTTGITPSCLIALMVRKYGQDLESWIGYPSTETFPEKTTPKSTGIDLPSDPGEGLPPVEL